jgi:hypothetical protein
MDGSGQVWTCMDVWTMDLGGLWQTRADSGGSLGKPWGSWTSLESRCELL